MRSRQCWRVVDAVPGHRYALARGLESLDLAMLVLGRDVCLDLVDTELAGYGFGGSAAVAGQHHHLDPALVQRPNGRSACRLDRIGDRDQPSRCAIEGYEHHSLTLGASGFCGREPFRILEIGRASGRAKGCQKVWNWVIH